MLHPQVESALRVAAAAGLKPFEEMSPADAREQTEASFRTKGAAQPVHLVTERRIPGSLGEIPVRLYRPDASPNLPAIVYYHGGGHVVGSLDTHDATARSLCRGVGCLVVSVDYRLAPENRFPAAVVDGFDAVRWTGREARQLGIDERRIGVAGESAGANLAAVAAIMARDTGGPPLSLQCLVYPVTDYTLSDASYDMFATGYGVLTRRAMMWFRSQYLRSPADAEDWRASPIKAASLCGLAPALIIAAECDVLRDEGKRYAEALASAGVTTDYREFRGMIHGFFGMTQSVDDADRAHKIVHAAFRNAFSRPATNEESAEPFSGTAVGNV